jgi:hypothetical protein
VKKVNENDFKFYDAMMRSNRSVTIPPDGSSSNSITRVVPKKCKGCKYRTPTCHFRIQNCEKDIRDKGGKAND